MRTTTKQVTSAAPGQAIYPEYSTVQAFNLDSSLFLLCHTDHFALYDKKGFIKDLPIGASDEPRWSKDYTQTIFYHSGNVLKLYDCTTGHVEELRKFEEYKSISGMGEGDISADGNHSALCGDGREIFVYTLHRDKKGPTLSVSGRPLESLYISADNSVLVSWGTEKIELYDKRMVFVKQLTSANGHKCVTTDTDGSPAMVWTNSDERGADPACQNGIELIRLESGERRCLLPLDWSLAVHISPGLGFVVVSTYSKPGPQVTWKDQILKVGLDGRIDYLGAHNSEVTSVYETQSWATVDHSGRKILYASNQGGRIDTHLLEIDPVPSVPGGARTYGRPRPSNKRSL